ncbi:phosphoribosylformylglycinamidine cyclo-ligase [Numidum massiliense]|uniref:phosphoribosylformylglycinamidine cyclo-ligase n=1 Tax=Numidum massiliense TaxID=1522315 RepID=UPI00093D144D|nr:phosphoribosylformylglycinamidine cyclo-ligase [Numidum massiliense]
MSATENSGAGQNSVNKAYACAGVNLEAGYETVARIKQHVARTARPEVLSGLGAFGGLFALPAGYREPVLVAGTDGVGTKLKLAFALDRHDTIGVDCVAMCVNDVAVQGAEPLFFLDYLATGELQPEQAEAVVKGIADGCAQAGCALIGGETAEMPGMYARGEYDVAGFCVGIAEREHLVTGVRIQAGDALIGLASSGLHSNGFSLVRRLLVDPDSTLLKRPVADVVAAIGGIAPHEKMSPAADGKTLGEELLTPTRIYVRTVLTLLREHTLNGMSHITGGGFFENVPRMLPDGLAAEITWGTWPVPTIFDVVRRAGKLSPEEMAQTFNCGIGFVLAVPEQEADAVIERANALGEQAYRIGAVVPQELSEKDGGNKAGGEEKAAGDVTVGVDVTVGADGATSGDATVEVGDTANPTRVTLKGDWS